ncbi:uncharacterized protein C8Q71DRAFT_743255 [Rhodofomes roseus]|uniref:Methyltransferase type 11 domain-containing protein n=1 Tax=Rhodofomes roseus TaxID=34475 RepID=A0ABQ8KRM8_9APHY|nr:uncharacterized protein C8Q71DRAFT_743255 [Rhodofomes roseus]KAH9841078.1 hypothetical protein C8Q71DRAFT_743255 [Rhodofomes roseus]
MGNVARYDLNTTSSCRLQHVDHFYLTNTILMSGDNGLSGPTSAATYDDRSQHRCGRTGRFKLVHQRLLIAALRSWEWTVALREIFRVLQPGGWVQLGEVGPWKAGPF